jgi:hypothetical protein
MSQIALAVAGSGDSSADILSPPTITSALALPTLEVRDIYVSGRYAYLVATGARLYIVDVARPGTPVLVGNLQDVTNMNGAHGVWVQGRYAYIAAITSDSLTVVDVGNHAAPVRVGGVTGASLNGATDVVVAGRYAYVTAADDDRLVVVDVSDPAAPVIAGSVQHTTNLNRCLGLAVQGRYAYVCSADSARLTAVDISDPASPAIAGSTANASGSAPSYVAVSGRYAYTITGGAANRMDVWDVSNPTAITQVANVVNANLDRPLGIAVANGYAYIPCQGDVGVLGIVDISNPTAPAYVTRVAQPTPGGGGPGSGELYHCFACVAQDRYLYVAVAGSGRLTILDLVGAGGSDVARRIGGLHAERLMVTQDADVVGTLNVGTGLGVGASGVRSDGDLTARRVVRPGTAVTASRPAATAVGAGAMFFDTTLAKPIWSDGTVWRDAAGTAV